MNRNQDSKAAALRFLLMYPVQPGSQFPPQNTQPHCPRRPALSRLPGTRALEAQSIRSSPIVEDAKSSRNFLFRAISEPTRIFPASGKTPTPTFRFSKRPKLSTRSCSSELYFKETGHTSVGRSVTRVSSVAQLANDELLFPDPVR